MTRATLAATAHSRPAEQGYDAGMRQRHSQPGCPADVPTASRCRRWMGKLLRPANCGQSGRQQNVGSRLYGRLSDFGARAMKDADLEARRAAHVLGQPEDLAGRQRSPHAAEYDDDESGATALMEGVGATAGGRLNRLHRGSNMRTGGRIDVGRRQQNRRAISFLGPDTKAGGHWTREIGKKGRSPG